MTNSEKVNALSEKMWDCFREFDYDPIDPLWENLKGELKEDILSLSKKLLGIVDILEKEEGK